MGGSDSQSPQVGRDDMEAIGQGGIRPRKCGLQSEPMQQQQIASAALLHGRRLWCRRHRRSIRSWSCTLRVCNRGRRYEKVIDDHPQPTDGGRLPDYVRRGPVRSACGRPDARACRHSLRHEAMRLRRDHAVLFRHDKPGRAVFPQRATDGDRDAGGRRAAERPLRPQARTPRRARPPRTPPRQMDHPVPVGHSFSSRWAGVEDAATVSPSSGASAAT